MQYRARADSAGFDKEKTMKKLALILAALCAVSAYADEWVNPYVRKDGTFVQGHHRTTTTARRATSTPTRASPAP
jgi:hypothetical protein